MMRLFAVLTQDTTRSRENQDFEPPPSLFNTILSQPSFDDAVEAVDHSAPSPKTIEDPFVALHADEGHNQVNTIHQAGHPINNLIAMIVRVSFQHCLLAVLLLATAQLPGSWTFLSNPFGDKSNTTATVDDTATLALTVVALTQFLTMKNAS